MLLCLARAKARIRKREREREKSAERRERDDDARPPASPLLRLLLRVLPPRRIKCLNFICGATLTGLRAELNF